MKINKKYCCISNIESKKLQLHSFNIERGLFYFSDVPNQPQHIINQALSSIKQILCKYKNTKPIDMRIFINNIELIEDKDKLNIINNFCIYEIEEKINYKINKLNLSQIIEKEELALKLNNIFITIGNNINDYSDEDIDKLYKLFKLNTKNQISLLIK